MRTLLLKGALMHAATTALPFLYSWRWTLCAGVAAVVVLVLMAETPEPENISKTHLTANKVTSSKKVPVLGVSEGRTPV